MSTGVKILLPITGVLGVVLFVLIWNINQEDKETARLEYEDQIRETEMLYHQKIVAQYEAEATLA